MQLCCTFRIRNAELTILVGKEVFVSKKLYQIHVIDGEKHNKLDEEIAEVITVFSPFAEIEQK